MPVDPNRKKVFCAYISDDNTVYNYVTTHNHAVAADATPSQDGLSRYPVGWKKRCIHGRSDDGTQRCKLVIPDPTNPLFLTDGTVGFSIDGVGLFIKTGSTGEKRPNGAPPLI